MYSVHRVLNPEAFHAWLFIFVFCLVVPIIVCFGVLARRGRKVRAARLQGATSLTCEQLLEDHQETLWWLAFLIAVALAVLMIIVSLSPHPNAVGPYLFLVHRIATAAFFGAILAILLRYDGARHPVAHRRINWFLVYPAFAGIVLTGTCMMIQMSTGAKIF